MVTSSVNFFLLFFYTDVLHIDPGLAGMALLHCRNAQAAHRLAAAQLLELLESLDALRRPERFAGFLQVCAIDAGAHGRSDHSGILQRALEAARAVLSRNLGTDVKLPERDEALFALATRVTGQPPTGGNRVELLTESEDAFERIEAAAGVHG